VKVAEHFTYLLVDILCLLFPLVFSFSRKFHFSSQWRYYFLPCLISAALFIGWDAIFTSLGVWGFDRRYVLGRYLYNLPLEEVLFFICIPYACTFTYYCVRQYRPVAYSALWRGFTLVFAFFLLIVGGIFLPRLYTSVTFLLLGVMLLVLGMRKTAFLPSFFVTYLVILVPFFISNGVLTGGYLQRVVVFYNGRYNLGIRLGTIPVEDVFYGMLLFLLNITGYEWAKTDKSHIRTSF